MPNKRLFRTALHCLHRLTVTRGIFTVCIGLGIENLRSMAKVQNSGFLCILFSASYISCDVNDVLKPCCVVWQNVFA
ncbi:hypothetical protein CEXT_19841 [Caerostris extrusa]|uniref:Secreted protein n=1 Tax=Caerostris extrusa TaxID=172846 RepID=A0AAV4M3J7_CAEEX|nr:hypothetical protein CEXT_19841 [Caerostris extrusa]